MDTRAGPIPFQDASPLYGGDGQMSLWPDDRLVRPRPRRPAVVLNPITRRMLRAAIASTLRRSGTRHHRPTGTRALYYDE